VEKVDGHPWISEVATNHISFERPGKGRKRVALFWDDLAATASSLAASLASFDVDEILDVLVLLDAQKSGGFDALVTESEVVDPLKEQAPGLFETSTTLTFDEASALAGLLGRSLGKTELIAGFTIPAEETRQVLALDLLSQWWRWEGATQNLPDLLALSKSVLRRIEFTLRIRDEIAIRNQLSPSGDANSDITFLFESGLLFLTAAFDAVARLANAAYDLQGSPYRIGWRNKRWRKRLRSVAPELADSMEEGASRERLALDAVAVPRNLIHGPGLPGVVSVPASAVGRPLRAVGEGVQIPIDRYAAATAVLLPPEEGTKLRKIIDELPRPQSWGLGVSFVAGGAPSLSLDPQRYLEHALRTTAGSLNHLMATIPAENLADPGDLPLPSEGNRKYCLFGQDQGDLFEPDLLERLRIQFGFSPRRIVA
jgi:hypothetical protein